MHTSTNVLTYDNKKFRRSELYSFSIVKLRLKFDILGESHPNYVVLAIMYFDKKCNLIELYNNELSQYVEA